MGDSRGTRSADYFSTYLHEAKALKLNSLCDESTTGFKGGRLDFLSRIPSRWPCGDLAIH